MLTHITQMDIKSPPAVCASVVYDAARRQWVPKVKLIYDGKERSVECGSQTKVCVCTGHAKIEIDGEEVSDEEALRIVGSQWEKVEEHRKKVDDLLQIADEMQTAFVVDRDEESSDKSEDVESDDESENENTGSRPSSPAAVEQRADRAERKEEKKEEEKEEKEKEEKEKEEKTVKANSRRVVRRRGV